MPKRMRRVSDMGKLLQLGVEAFRKHTGCGRSSSG